jgi:hypothetical protein
MVKNIAYSVVFLLVGLLVGWVGHCAYSSTESPTEVISVRTDTIVQRIEVKVPERKVIYLSKTDTLLKNIVNERLITEYCTDTVTGLVETSVYSDTVINNDFRFEYEIQTLGELIHFDPRLVIFPRPCPKSSKPKWIITSAISNKGNFKVGGGYKGWVVEAELKENLNQVFFGYHYQF